MINSLDSTPILSTPIKFGESCSNLTFNITLPEGMIDISDKPILNKDSLERLLIFLKKNIKVGTVKWNEEQDRFDFTFCKIIKQLKKNNERFNYHPSDYMAGVISAHVYSSPEILAKRKVDFRDISVINQPNTTSSQLESINSYLGQLEIINYLNDQGFQYALYENKEMHHLILAFRGTVVTNLREAAFTLFEDAYMITLRNKDSFQSRMVSKVVAAAVELCNKKHYHLTIVGHSLGAFLAELCHYHCFYTHNFTHVKTITFDSPGALDQFKVIDNHVIPSTPYEAMEMISYLSEPNIVNSMNNHIFDNNTTFRIYPDGVEELDNSKFDYIIGAKFHSLGFILNCFDFETGKPSKYKVVKKWPLIDSKNISSFLSYFKNNDNGALEKPGLSEELAKQVHYQVLEIDNYVGNLNLLDSFKIDKLLIQLSIKNFFSQFNDYFISTQLKELKQLYHVNENKLSITNQSITFELLKQRIARIVNLNPKEISKMLFSQSGQLDTVTDKQYKIRINHLPIDGFYDSNDYIGKLSEIHKTSNLAIITGEEGSGKSAISLEYAMNHLPKLPLISSKFNEFKVLFIRGGSREMIFEDFANHLLKNYQNEHNGYDFQLSSNQLIDFYKVLMDSQNVHYIFIFDNVEDISLIEPFLFYLPKSNTKSIITSQVTNGRAIERVLSLGKQNTSDITMCVTLLDNKQANDYLVSRGIANSNCNFSSPISIHLLNILINSFKSMGDNNAGVDENNIVNDFSKTLSKLLFDFIEVNPLSVKLLNVLPFLDPDSISYDIISQIDKTIDIPENVKYWSGVSIINDLPGEKINTYKYIQQLIMDEILEDDKEKQSIISTLINIYSGLNVSGQHPKGWRIYLPHLKYFYNNFFDHCRDNVQIIENLGICFKLCCQFQESIKILSVALEIKKKNGSSANEIASTLYQIANTYHKSLDYEQALLYYSMVLSSSSVDQDLITNTYNEIGDCHFNLNRIDIALDLFEKSLSTVSKSDFELISSIHLNIGDVYLEKGQLTNAKQEFTIALETIEQVSTETSPILSKSHFKLAMIEYLQSNFTLAIEKFNKSIQLYKELFKSSLHKNVATSFEKIGLCYLNDTTIERGTGTLLLSLENLQQSLNIRLKIHRTNLNHQDLLSSYSNLSKCYKKRLEYKESYQCLRKCYEIQKVNNDSTLLILTLQSLSTISFLSKDYKGSIDYSTKLLNNHLENIDQFTLSSIYKNIGENYKLLGTFDQAVINFEKSIEITTKLIVDNEKVINISTILKKKDTNSNLDFLLSTLKLYEFIGSIYYSLISITVNSDKKKLLSSRLRHYFNILVSFEKLKLIDLSSSNWFIQYKNSNSNFFTIKRIFIISTILIVLISYYQLNK